MIRQRTKILIFLLYLGDTAATLLAFLTAYSLRNTFPPEFYSILFPLEYYFNLFLAVLPIWFIFFYSIGLYRDWRGIGSWKETWMVVKAVLISSFILGFMVFALKFQFVSRIFLLLFTFWDLLFVLLIRQVIKATIRSLKKKSENSRIILIIGTGENGLTVARGIERHKDLGFRIIGFLTCAQDATSTMMAGYPILGKAQDLPQVLEKEIVDEVIFAIPQNELKGMENLFLLCEERGITARVVMNFFPHVIAKTHLEELDGVPLLTFTTTPKNELMLLLRRILDMIGSLFFIILGSPMFLLITLLIRLDSPGSAIFRQTRCGLNGRKFTFLKFRSMVQGAQEMKDELSAHNEMDGPVFKIKNDPRVTRVGWFLRKTSLDELPQLFNVLRGDMSFVGPRPPLPEEVEKYEGWQRRRLSMKPGITGLWQVSGRNQIDFKEWMKLDLEYIDNWSLWLDLKILLRTIPVVLTGKGAM